MRKKYRHELASLVDACNIDVKKFVGHDKAAQRDFQKVVLETGTMTISQLAEMFERNYTQHELAFMLGNVAAMRVKKFVTQTIDAPNVAMMFG